MVARFLPLVWLAAWATVAAGQGRDATEVITFDLERVFE
jgi:hypothetical protein